MSIDTQFQPLKDRIEKALADFTSGRASMHVPPMDTDVDMVLADCQSQLTAITSQLESVVAENSGLRHLLDKIGETGNANFGRTSLPTPATDAFLAEVRASGVEMAACALDDVNQFNYANMLDELAQKIRQGGAV